MANLQERFESFVKTVRAFESVDDELLRSARHKNKKRADYLLWERQIIVEQKVLSYDPFERAQRFINRLMSQRGVIAYGTVSTNRVFARLPSPADRVQGRISTRLTL
jgi:hypothetical protein